MKQIYIVRAGATGAIKIGVSVDVPKRLKALTVGSAEDLELLAFFPGGHALEKALHAHLKEHHLRGEWFANHPEVWDAVERAKEGSLWSVDDWVEEARRLRKKGLSYKQLSEVFGYSHEHIRQQLAPSYKRPGEGRVDNLRVVEYTARNEDHCMSEPTGIDRAVSEAGSQTALAELLGVTQQAVAKWQGRGWAPLARAKQIANAFPIGFKELIDPKLKDWML